MYEFDEAKKQTPSNNCEHSSKNGLFIAKFWFSMCHLFPCCPFNLSSQCFCCCCWLWFLILLYFFHKLALLLVDISEKKAPYVFVAIVHYPFRYHHNKMTIQRYAPSKFLTIAPNGKFCCESDRVVGRKENAGAIKHFHIWIKCGHEMGSWIYSM